MNRHKYEIDMTHGTIMDKLISFFLPLMLSNILQLLFNAVDIVVVGRFSGNEALAAVGSTTALIAIFTNLFIGISQGSNVLAARYYAAGRKTEMEESVHTAICFGLISGIVMIFVGEALGRWALQLLDTPANVIQLSLLYLRIYFLGVPFFMLYNYGAAILRAVGDTKRPLYFLIFSGILNAGLNLFLVIVFHLGVAGVAIATVVSQFVSCTLVIRTLITSKGLYRLQLSKLSIKWPYLKQILIVGVPAGLQSTIINVSNALLQSSVNSFGSVAMAGYTAANNILGFMYFSVNSITQAAMSFVSQNYGVGEKKRMDRIFVDCIILEVAVSVLMGCGARIFVRQLLGIYTKSPEVIACGMEILALPTITYSICGIMDMIPGTMRGMGHSTVPMVLSVIGTVGTRVVWIFYLFPAHRSLYFLFISYPLSWIITVAMQLFCYYFVRKKVHMSMKSSV